MRALFYRSIWLPAIVAAVFLMMTLGMLVTMSWHSLQRLDPVHKHLALASRIQQADLALQGLMVRSTHGDAVLDQEELKQLRRSLSEIAASDELLSPETPQRLKQISDLLSDPNQEPRRTLTATLGLMRDILSSETRARDQLRARIDHDTAMEFEIAATALIVFPLLAMLTMFFLRHRILRPLNNLRFLMAQLAQQDYSVVPTRDVDQMLQPLFENYNALVAQLAHLEQARKARQHMLEQEVRAATRTVLEQQRTLASAERLAAIGEVAAGVAHELRNPLAGIQLSLSNLRREIPDSEHSARLDLVISELKRMTRLLNDLLSQAQQTPEPSKDIVPATLLEELLALARYQVSPEIHLEHHISPDLMCHLPEDRLRQALLNLVLNGAQAIGERSGVVQVDAQVLDNQIQFSVCDSGPGFPPEILETGGRFFDTRRAHGTGVGLAMVRRFARDLGGEMHLANQTPDGTCVTLSLPWKRTDHG
jgi:two-component system NtrC family sensor kinase